LLFKLQKTDFSGLSQNMRLTHVLRAPAAKNWVTDKARLQSWLIIFPHFLLETGLFFIAAAGLEGDLIGRIALISQVFLPTQREKVFFSTVYCSLYSTYRHETRRWIFPSPNPGTRCWAAPRAR
jgi:hypothetical protein